MYGSLASLRTSVGSTVLFEVSYEWGEDGLLRAQTENVQGTRTRIEYTHDGAGRLVSVRRDGVETERYTWDANNVRTSALSGTTVLAAMHDGRDRLQQHGSDVLQHDRSGRLLSAQRAGGTQRWTWGSAGELTSVQLGDGRVVRYTLDAMGRRVGRRVGEGSARYWLQGEGTSPIAELREDGSVQSVYAYGRLGWVPEAVVRGSQTLALVLDAQGSVRLVVNAETGEVVARRDYDAFGRERNRMGDAGIPFGYAGGWVDEDTGTLRFGAREYSPEWGRWLTPDPAGFGAGDGNLYGYVLGMPHWAVDPSGFSAAEDWSYLQQIEQELEVVIPVLGGGARVVGPLISEGAFSAYIAAEVSALAAGVTLGFGIAAVVIGGIAVVEYLSSGPPSGGYRTPPLTGNSPRPVTVPGGDGDDNCSDPCEVFIQSVLRAAEHTAAGMHLATAGSIVEATVLWKHLTAQPSPNYALACAPLGLHIVSAPGLGSCAQRCRTRVSDCSRAVRRVHEALQTAPAATLQIYTGTCL